MPAARRWLLMSVPVLALAGMLRGQGEVSPHQPAPAGIRLRRPVALTLAAQGKMLLVANRDSGTVVVLDTQRLRPVREVRVGRKLSDLTATGDGTLLLATDEAAGELVLLEPRPGAPRVLTRLRVGLSPVGVRATGDGRLAAVACLWPHRLAIVDLAAARKGGSNAPAPTAIDLPFAPRRLLAVPGGPRVIVADAFAGKLAVVDLRARVVASVRDLAVHNVRGLALDRRGATLWLTHQTLNGQGHTTAGDIQNGNVLTNNVHAFALAAVLDPWADVLRDDRLYSLGDIERGAGDPAEIADVDGGRVVVTLAGVNELAIGRPEEALWTRLRVGRRPTALAVDAAGRRAYVANTLADTISVVDLQVPRVVAEVSLGPAAELTPPERGELLFYDARLSHDAWFSCHSCHPDGHTSGRLNDNFTDGSFGTPKRVLTLLGVKDTGPWAWNGRMPSLEAQVRTSVTSTMRGPSPSDDQVRDLTAFLQTLTPPPSLASARGTVDAEAVKRGRRVFARQKCATCHPPPTYTTAGSFDVGLRDEAGGTHFNPPSLRGLSQAGPYFHDNRARTLEEVFGRYRHQLAGDLSAQELRDLLCFLESL